MKIDGSAGHSINFVEQRSNSKKIDTKEGIEKTRELVDTFLKSELTSREILNANDSIGMLQVAFESIRQLKNNTEKLQDLSTQYGVNSGSSIELEAQFESVTDTMLDVVDNTLYQNTQLFYTNFLFAKGEESISVSLSENINIDDLSIDSAEKLESFKKRLTSLEDEITGLKNYLELATFNSLAATKEEALNGIDFVNLGDIESNSSTINLDKEGLKRAHDTDSLKDKLSFLLD